MAAQTRMNSETPVGNQTVYQSELYRKQRMHQQAGDHSNSRMEAQEQSMQQQARDHSNSTSVQVHPLETRCPGLMAMIWAYPLQPTSN